MKFTYKDIIATLLIAAIVVPYLGYLVRGEMPFIQDPRGMAATGLVLGLAAAAMTGRAMFAPGLWHRITLAVGIVTLGLGVAAIWAEWSEALLAGFMAGIVITYVLAELLHLRVLEPASATRPVPLHG